MAIQTGLADVLLADEASVNLRASPKQLVDRKYA